MSLRRRWNRFVVALFTIYELRSEGCNNPRMAIFYVQTV